MLFLEDLPLDQPFPCGLFRLTRAEIIAFAQAFDPQPFHLDDAAAERSYFGRLCASGLHTQGMAIGLMVRAIADVAVVAGYALHEARFRHRRDPRRNPGRHPRRHLRRRPPHAIAPSPLASPPP